jgi:hypothetical protein
VNLKKKIEADEYRITFIEIEKKGELMKMK